jgi:hypothetical protein
MTDRIQFKNHGQLTRSLKISEDKGNFIGLYLLLDVMEPSFST